PQPLPITGGDALAHAAARLAAAAELLVEEAPGAVVDGPVDSLAGFFAQGVGGVDLGDQLHRRGGADRIPDGGPVGQLAVSGVFPGHGHGEILRCSRKKPYPVWRRSATSAGVGNGDPAGSASGPPGGVARAACRFANRRANTLAMALSFNVWRG